MFPPGRASDATNPEPTGSATPAMMIGIVAVLLRAAAIACVLDGDNKINVKTDEFRRQLREACRVGVQQSVPQAPRCDLPPIRARGGRSANTCHTRLTAGSEDDEDERIPMRRVFSAD